MPTVYPNVAKYVRELISKGYKLEIYKQKNGKYAIVSIKDSEKFGVSLESLNLKMFIAALIKIKRKIEPYPQKEE